MMGVHDGTVLDAATCDRIRSAMPTTHETSRDMGEWGREVMERHRECCGLQSWYDPRRGVYRWFMPGGRQMIASFSYKGLHIRATVVVQQDGYREVEEWDASIPFNSLAGITQVPVPYDTQDALAECKSWMDGLRKQAIMEAR